MKNKKWKVLVSKTMYSCPYFTVVEHTAIRPNGKTLPYFQITKEDFSIVIPIDGEATYLIGQYRLPAKKYSWEFPMGAVLGKTPQEVAHQELREETGFTAKDMTHLGSFFVANGYSDQQAHVYEAKNMIGGSAVPEETEFLEVRKVPLSDIPKLISSGEIHDGPTITAYYFFISKRPFV